MTMVEENALREMLRLDAESIEIPEGGPERILAASRATTTQARRRRPHLTLPDLSWSRGRRIVVAAVVILVVGGVTLSLLAVNPGRSPVTTAASSSGSSAASGSISPGAAVPTPARSGTAHAPTASGSPATSTPSNSVPPLPSGAVGQSPKVESNGSISLTVANGRLQQVLAKLTALASGAGGFVASTQAQTGSEGSTSPSSGTIVLQVPQLAFGTVVAQVQQVGHTTSVTTASSNVTGQYVDVQARITALEASRQQYLTIMAQATSIGDILAVQSQLDAIQSQIEQLQGQLSVLDNQTTYGSLTVNLNEAGRRPVLPVQPATGLRKAWDDGIGGFVSGFEWLIRIAGTTLFVLLCLAALLLLVRWGWRATRRRML
jgi:hypothetical protein